METETKIWVCSDLHFGHINIIKYYPKTRGHFKDVDHMTEEMILEWNKTVRENDLTYILGDVAFLPSAKAVAIMRRLNGRKILIQGNHDLKILRDPVFFSCFEEVHPYLRITYNGQIVVMFHYPIYDHDQCGRGSIMLHGHRHGNPHSIPGRIMDVGYDATGKIVTDLDSIIKKMQSIQPLHHH